jgi:hypothetical protein
MFRMAKKQLAQFTFTRQTYSGKVLAKGEGNSLFEAMDDADRKAAKNAKKRPTAKKKVK